MKYIDAEKLTAEIERRRLSNRYIDTEGYENELLEIIDSLQQEQTPTEREIAEAHHYAEMIREWDKARIQQEQSDTKESISHLEHWLAFFGCPEENIEKCATQIAQGYGAIRYLEGIRHGAEAVNELAQQEQSEVDLEKEYKTWWNSISDKINIEHMMEWYMHETARHFAEWGAINLSARKEK